MNKIIIISVLTLFNSLIFADSVTQKPKKECSTKRLTIYNDLALVEGESYFSITRGSNSLTLSELPAGIIENSLLVTFLEEGISLVESKFEGVDHLKEFKISATSSVDGYLPLQYTYATSGVSWEAFYMGEFSYEYDKLHFNGWFNVKNETNLDFKGVSLVFSNQSSHLLNAQNEIQGAEKPLYFTVERCVDLPEKKSIQVSWASRSSVPVSKEYRLDLGGEFLTDQTNKSTDPNVDLWISCENGARNLPTGPLILYHRDKKGHNRALTKTILPDVSKLSNYAFKMPRFSISEKHLQPPIKVTYEQTEFQRFTGKLIETANRLTLRNTSSDQVTMKVFVKFPSKDDLILRESMQHQVDKNYGNYWIIKIPGNDKAELRYRLRFSQH